MQDSQDNTFPIPGADNTANQQVGGSDVQPGASAQPGDLASAQQPAQPTQVPQPVQPADLSATQPAPLGGMPPTNLQTQPVQPAPVAPDWQNQATADAVALPAGVDNYAVNTPSQPVYDQSTQGVQPLQSVQPMMPEAPVATQPVVPVSDPYTNPTAIPQGNTLDLSGQPLNQPVQPILPNQLDQQAPYAVPVEPGVMQPGVDVQPTTQVASSMPGMPGDDMAGLPSDFGTSFNAQADDMAAAQNAKKSKPMKLIIIGVAVLAVVLILGLVLVFSSRNSRKPAIQLNETPVTQPDQAKDSNSITPAAIPAGYQKVDRDCYSYGVLLPTTVDFTKTACSMDAKFGSLSQYILTVAPVTDAVVDLQNLVDKAKVGTITSQDDIKLGGVAAKKIIQKVNGLDQQTVVVIPTNKAYLSAGKSVNGFIINSSASDDASKAASATLISTWVWK